MRPMPLIVDWSDLCVRLALAVIAGALIGFNRDEHGRPAGLRTTILVCVAASAAMLQANLLLPTVGKVRDGFAVADILRLPLGILSGIGFIGAGAIVRRGSLVRGVTTAATLWVVTVIGLCFGGGQITLGIGTALISLIVLRPLKAVEENYILQDRHATLCLVVDPDGPNADRITALLQAADMEISGQAITYSNRALLREIRYEVRWRATRSNVRSPEFLSELGGCAGVQKLSWVPADLDN